MWRSCRVGHITASALVIEEQGRGVLLTLHPKVGRWLQLGGHLEPADASVLHGAVREVREESGIARGRISSVPVRLDRHDVPCGRDDDGRVLASVHWDMQFVVVVPNAIPPVISDESDDLAWFPSLSLPDVDASVQALCDDAERALSEPRGSDAGAARFYRRAADAERAAAKKWPDAVFSFTRAAFSRFTQSLN